MELVIGLIVIGVLGYFAFFRKKEEVAEVAPYKVETPAPVVVEETPAPTPAPVAQVETLPVEVPVLTEEVVAPAPVKKPRKPRAPKVEATPVKAPAKAKAPAVKAKATTTVKAPAKKAAAVIVAKKPRAKKS